MRAWESGLKLFLQLFKTQYISTHYYESCDKKLWQNLNFGNQGNMDPLNKWFLLKDKFVCYLPSIVCRYSAVLIQVIQKLVSK